MSVLADRASGAGVLDRLQVLRSAPTPLRGAPAATWPPSPRTGVRQLRVAGHDYDENRPSRLHLSNARSWSEEWGPPPWTPFFGQGFVTAKVESGSRFKLLRLLAFE